MISSDTQHRLIAKSIAKGISYPEYRKMVKELAKTENLPGLTRMHP